MQQLIGADVEALAAHHRLVRLPTLRCVENEARAVVRQSRPYGSLQAAILAYLAEHGASRAPDIAAALDRPRNSISTAAWQLRTRGLVRTLSTGLYALVDAPADPDEVRLAALSKLGPKQCAVLAYARDAGGAFRRIDTARATGICEGQIASILAGLIARRLIRRVSVGLYRLAKPADYYEGL